tara:strand:+ start:513 stop:893 length:381 start_codon:yes stop_codon:yes gene_type:complete
MIVEYTIQGQINSSVQVGDNIYFSLKTPNSSYETSNSFTYSGVVDSIEIGLSSSIISVNVDNDSNIPGGSDYENIDVNDYFLFFSKDSSVNISRVKGYHANVIMINDSSEKAELFTVGAEIQKSSK